jgi:hypothetical protein
MGRAGAGFLDSAMKFGYAKREGANVNAEPHSPVQSFHVDDEPNTNNENKHKYANNEFTQYNETNRITKRVNVPYQQPLNPCLRMVLQVVWDYWQHGSC